MYWLEHYHPQKTPLAFSINYWEDNSLSLLNIMNIPTSHKEAWLLMCIKVFFLKSLCPPSHFSVTVLEIIQSIFSLGPELI